MPLLPGQKLGPYEILAPIGAGGMGEVYRARDTRLERTVAIKVLPSHLSANPDLRQRFEREARVVSSLNHPHICTLYDIGRQDGVDFLVMEYLEGETLADRLAKGPLSTEQVLRTAVEIADALDKAHRQGVVHRDLKPGNVMLTRSGVKLLDFGLAKLRGSGPSPAFPAASALPTESRPLTAEGSIPGTLQYMAPEQLEGKEADARTDIFALGEIIYEMATRRRPFEGKSQASLIAAILTSEPAPIPSLQPMSPPMLDRAVRRCLAKDSEARWQSARDLLLELEWIREARSPAEALAPRMVRRRNRERLAWLAAVVALTAAVGLTIIIHFRRPTTQPHAARFSVSLPGNASIAFVRVSPDGRYLSFTAISGGKSQLWLRPLNALSARPLSGTERARYHFWSPDSRFIGFFADGKLKRIDVTGGSPQILCDAPGSGPIQLGTWGREGTILFNVDEAPGQEGLYRVSAAGGAATRLPILDESGKELMVAWPNFLPDGRHFVFACVPAGDLDIEKAGTCVASLDTGQARKLMDTPSAVEYAPPGFLLYSRSGTLLAHPFDADELRLHGEPVRIAEQIGHYLNLGVPTFSVSENGVLALLQAGGTQSRLVWKDRKGLVLGQVGPQAEYADMRLSPDGRKLAVSIADQQSRATDIWVIEITRNVATRFTSEAAEAGFPLWSPDGSRIVFSVAQNAPPFLHQKPLTGGEQEVLLPSTGTVQWATDWSPDGRFLLYADRNPNTNWDIWILPLAGERKPIPFVHTRFRETQATFSPDGHWVAFVSDESDSLEVYVQPFQGPGEKRRISTAGGTLPRWRRDGRELFYLSLDNQLMAVPLKLGAGFEPETPTALFSIEPAPGAEIEYDASGDGQRFIVNAAVPGTAGPPTVVLDWTAELKQ